MLRTLSIALFVLPCIEIWIFINLTFFMSLSTILLQSTVTMVAGLWLVQGENISLWTLIKSELLNKRIPAEELLDAGAQEIFNRPLDLKNYFKNLYN